MDHWLEAPPLVVLHCSIVLSADLRSPVDLQVSEDPVAVDHCPIVVVVAAAVAAVVVLPLAEDTVHDIVPDYLAIQLQRERNQN
jgi:hypothetical protein